MWPFRKTYAQEVAILRGKQARLVELKKLADMWKNVYYTDRYLDLVEIVAEAEARLHVAPKP